MIRTIGTVVSGLAVAAALLTAACAPRIIDGACSEFVPMTYSAAGDTPETKAQIRGHNAVWDRLCK